MNQSEKISCAACGREVDAHARACPFCGANPRTGSRPEPRPGLDELFPKRRAPGRKERVADAIRSRKGLVFGVSLVVAIIALIVLSNWVSQRQDETVPDPPVPLTEVTDLAASSEDPTEQPEMPELELEYDGDPTAMESPILEEGETAPDE